MTERRPVGIEIFYWMEKWSDDQASYFHKARQAGYDGVEISLVAGTEPPVARIKAEAEVHGLRVLASTGLSPALDISSEDSEISSAGIAHLIGALEAASALGSPVLGGVTYAPWFHFPDENDLTARRRRSAEALSRVAPVAHDLGVDLCLEILNRFETFMFNTVDEALEYVAMVDHPAIKLELDTFHMNMEEDDLARAIRAAGSRLGHFQCAANNRRPPQYGHIDWRPLKSALDEIGYDGWLVFETFPNPTVETGRTTHTWRHLATDPDREAAEASVFIRERLA